MGTNSEMYTTFFDSARNVAWTAIQELGDRIKCGMLNTQNDLREEKKHTHQTLRGDIIDLVIESCALDRQIASRNILLTNLASELGL